MLRKSFSLKNPKSKIQNLKFPAPAPAPAPAVAAIETVLVLPIILAFLIMLLYFGRGIVRLQQARVMDRYEAWRKAAHVNLVVAQAETDYYRDGPSGTSLGPAGLQSTDNTQLNQTFFGGHAASIGDLVSHDFPQDAPQQLITAAGEYSANTGQVAQVFIQEASSEHESNFIISYPDDAGLLARFNGSFKHRHERPGDDWAFADGWRVVEFDQQTVSGWGYDSMTPLDEDEPDPQRKVRLQLTNDVIGREPVIVSDTAGGGVVPRNDGNTYMVWRRQGPSATVHDAVRQVFFTGFDTPLQSLVTNGNVVAIATQNAYTQEPSYHGPNPDYPPAQNP